ncbi:MaoC family dehydratase [Streptomyces sp. NPDC014733]|uniref:MaoC family dehydratase n=1 Tax=Streptomyces sp. NPDC014733 TaxID=3364885 RepID=UPI0036FA567E
MTGHPHHGGGESTRYFEDFPVGSVYELGSCEITAADIIEFGTKFDPQPYHIDEESGKASPFRGLIASGWHTASLFMRLYVDSLLLDSAAVGSPGVDDLRWLRPVRPGEVLHGRLTVVDSAPAPFRPECGVLRKRGVMRDAEGRPVLKLLLFSMVLRRPAAPPPVESRGDGAG